jgi:hypothetical protein
MERKMEEIWFPDKPIQEADIDLMSIKNFLTFIPQKKQG